MLLAGPTNAASLTGTVVRVTDGDTVTLLADSARIRIRLSEIDAPERKQAFGEEARSALAELVQGKTVSVEIVGTSRFGMLLGRLDVDGVDVNRHMIASGFAWAYRAYLSDQSLLDDERSARDQRAGLWSQPEPVAPWEWRKRPQPANPASRSQDKPTRCGAKRTCGQMNSCAEARFYLRQCGLTRLDGDGDGVPCERLCR